MTLKILHTVQSYPPSQGGMAEVVRQISERLAAKGHSITVATEFHADRTSGRMNGVHVQSFAVTGSAVNGYEGDIKEYEKFLLESQFDVVVNFAAQQWATDIALPLLSRIAGRKVFVPTGFSGLYSRRFRDYFRQLPEFMRQYDMNVFLSDSYRDISFARRHAISRTMLIPNGAAADEFLASVPDLRPRIGIPAGHFLILHVGSHTGLKGHDEAMDIFKLADIREATLLIVGNEPSGGCGTLCTDKANALNATTQFYNNGKRIIVKVLSRADIVAAYQAADLFLFPSNIECSPIVLFECMASKTPFLVTDVGNSAEIISWSGGAGLLLPSDRPSFLPKYGSLRDRCIQKLRILFGRADDFAAVKSDLQGAASLLTFLHQNVGERRQMAVNGFSAWQERFTWEIISEEYEALYKKLVEGNE